MPGVLAPKHEGGPAARSGEYHHCVAPGSRAGGGAQLLSAARGVNGVDFFPFFLAYAVWGLPPPSVLSEWLFLQGTCIFSLLT